MEQLPDVEQLVTWIHRPGGEPLDLLTDAVILSGRLGDLADQVVDHFVQRAREDGASWAEIGQAMGVSKQAAQKRFVHRGPGIRDLGKGLFARFSPDARTAVKRAVGYGHELGSPKITTAHLVAALTEQSCDATAVLEGSGADVQGIHGAALDSLSEVSKGAPSSGHIPFNSDAKRVLELSLREAIHGESRQIGTEHILLGILRDAGSPGARLLAESGVSPRAVRTWLSGNPTS